MVMVYARSSEKTARATAAAERMVTVYATSSEKTARATAAADAPPVVVMAEGKISVAHHAASERFRPASSPAAVSSLAP